MMIIVGVGISLAGLVGQSMTDFSKNLPEYKAQLKEFMWVVNVAARYNILIDKEQIISLFDPGKPSVLPLTC